MAARACSQAASRAGKPAALTEWSSWRWDLLDGWGFPEGGGVGGGGDVGERCGQDEEGDDG